MKAHPRPSRGWLGQVLLVVLVGLLTFHLLRNHLCEYYLIPSASMEPTLHGDPSQGELVLVDKTAFWRRQPQPFDVVVLRRPDAAQKLLVKRFIAKGPCSLKIAEGDLARRDDDGHWHLLHKDPIAYADMRIGVFEFGQQLAKPTRASQFFHLPVGLAEESPAVVHLRPGFPDHASLLASLAKDDTSPGVQLDSRLPGHISTLKPVDSSYVDGSGQRCYEGQFFYPDIGLELDLQVRPGMHALQLIYEYQDALFSLSYSSDGLGLLRLPGEGQQHSFIGPALSTEQANALVFGYLDGHLFFVLGETLLLHHPVVLPRNPQCRRQNALHLGLAGKAGAVLSRLRVFHDIHYATAGGSRAQGQQPYELEPGELFLLGDNSHDSADSRFATFNQPRTPSLTDLVGRPVAVIAPWSQARMLVR